MILWKLDRLWEPVIEAVGGGDQDPGGEDGGSAHEVSLARALPQEQRGQPREAAVLRLRGSGAILVCPDNATSPGALLRPRESGQQQDLCHMGTSWVTPSLLPSLGAKTNHSLSAFEGGLPIVTRCHIMAYIL